MPNYAITANYQPFSFQERIAPLQMLKQEYDTVAQGLATLGEEANSWQQYIDPNSRSGQKLAAYNQALSTTADSLSKEGLKAVSRNALFNLRRAYNSDIAQINKAAQTLSGIYDQYRNMSAKDQSLMIGSMPTVDDLVDNPAASPVMVSGMQLYAQANQAAKSAASRNTTFSAALDGVLRGYYHTIQTTGYDSEATARFIEDASTIPELQKAMEEIRQMNNTAALNNPGQADAYILRGILDGMTFNKKEDFKYDQVGAENRAAARQRALDLAQQQATFKATNPVTARPIYTQRERTEDVKHFNKLSGLFTQEADGTYSLNQRGERLFKQAAQNMKYAAEHSDVPRREGTYGLDPVRAFLEENGISSQNATKETIEQAFTNFYKKTEGQLKDATRATEYFYEIDSSDKTNWMSKLLASAVDGKLYTSEWNPKTQRFVRGDTVKVSDLKNATPVSFNASPYGQTITVNIPDKGPMTFEFKGYNQNIDKLISESLYNISVGENNVNELIRGMGLNPEEVNPNTLLQELISMAQNGDRNAAIWAQYLQNELMKYEQDQHGLMSAMGQYGHTYTNKPTEQVGFDF